MVTNHHVSLWDAHNNCFGSKKGATMPGKLYLVCPTLRLPLSFTFPPLSFPPSFSFALVATLCWACCTLCFIDLPWRLLWALADLFSPDEGGTLLASEAIVVSISQTYLVIWYYVLHLKNNLQQLCKWKYRICTTQVSWNSVDVRVQNQDVVYHSCV